MILLKFAKRVLIPREIRDVAKMRTTEGVDSSLIQGSSNSASSARPKPDAIRFVDTRKDYFIPRLFFILW